MIRETTTGAPVEDLVGTVMAEERGTSGRSWVMLNMVTSLDGAISIDGGSTGLSDEDDRRLFHAIRAVPDTILVGAGTVRSEDYRPVTLDEQRRAARLKHGLSAVPDLVIVSGSLNLDPAARVFSDPAYRPSILTGPAAGKDAIARLEGLASVFVLPELDGVGIVQHLSDSRVILCEGGPTLNGHLFGAGLVDELDWTISPMLVGGGNGGMAKSSLLEPPTDMTLARVWRGTRSLFLRYVRAV